MSDEVEVKSRALVKLGYPAEVARTMAEAHKGPMTLDFLTRAEKLLEDTPAAIKKQPGFWQRHWMKFNNGCMIVSVWVLWMFPNLSSSANAAWLYGIGILVVVMLINIARAITRPMEKTIRRRKTRL